MFSCIGRGPYFYGGDDRDLALLCRRFPGLPVLGTYSTGQIAQVTAARDFDMAGWGFALASDDGAMWALAQNFSSTSTTNRVGYKNAAVDQALKGLLVAKTDAEKTALYAEIAKAVATDVPFLPWAAVEEYVAYSPKVHGILGTNKGTVLLHDAWME